MIPTGREIVYALYGAWRLARLDGGGMAYFDRTVDGFWKSFFAAALVAPGYVILVASHLAHAAPASGVARIVVVQLVAYVISWVAFPLAAYYLTQAIDRQGHYVGYIVAFNWAKVLQMVVYLPVTLIAVMGLLPAQGIGLLNFGVTLLILGYEWFVTRTALMVGTLAAVGFVVLDLILSVIITASAEGMIR